jgi:Protein of unknown function (DUF3429)
MNVPTHALALHEPPADAARLSYLGLLPFVLGAALLWLIDSPEPHAFVALALAAYGATVLAFLGGVHWGLTMNEHGEPPKARRWSVVPPLAGTLAVAMPAYSGLPLVGMMLVVCYLVDRRLYPQAQLAHWLTLRFRLTVVAALCCFLAAAAT